MALPLSLGTTVQMASVRGRCGPFISSAGNVYLILADNADRSILEIWKATDPTSSFSEADSANHRDLANVMINVDAVQVGDVLHIAVVEAVSTNNSGRVSYHTFNMATDAWALNEEIVAAPSPTQTLSGVGIAVRSDGDVIVGYSGARDTVTMSNWARAKYARRESGSWTVNVALDNGGSDDWIVGCAVLGSSDRTHFFLLSDTDNDLFQRCLRSDNSLETFPAAIDATTGSGTNNGDIGTGVAFVDGGTTKIRVPYYDTTTQGVAALDSADTPTPSTSANLTGSTAVAGNPGGVSGMSLGRHTMAANGSDVYLLWLNQDTGRLYRKVLSGGSWGADTETFVPATSIGDLTANVFVRGGNYKLAYALRDGTIVRYNELDLGSATPSEGQPTSRRWGGVPGMTPGQPFSGSGRSWNKVIGRAA